MGRCSKARLAAARQSGCCIWLACLNTSACMTWNQSQPIQVTPVVDVDKILRAGRALPDCLAASMPIGTGSIHQNIKCSLVPKHTLTCDERKEEKI